MRRKILFTPIGGTDPISSTNVHDGSMLHICRVYKPDKVIMYMSKEMLDYQREDDRYRYCLDKLAAMQKRTMEYEIIERYDLTEVHEFDYFYQDFREIFEQIYRGMEPTDQLLLNVSSGTPAMKSGLLVLQTLGEFPATLIQVATPEKKINEHIHKDYDVKYLWEQNADNQKNFINRCKKVSCPTLSKIKKEEIIKKHIQVYDYQAALDAANTLSEEETASYRDFLYLASRRIMLDFNEVDRMVQNTGVQPLPITSADRKYFEYALNVEIRLKRGEYVDFVRSITPLVVDLFELILKQECGIDINDYCKTWKERGRTRRKWSMHKLDGSSVGEKLNKAFEKDGGFKGGDISSMHLKTLIAYFSADQYLVKLVENVRKIETNIRNLAAHEIVSVTEATMSNMTGFIGEEIMTMIKELFPHTGIMVKREYWNSYDQMNEMILEKMSLES